MARLSPSPSGRRLAELLEEKQEPFLLDLHLLEKGCSSSRLLLDDGYDTTALLCWPAPGNDAAAAVLKRLTSNNKSKKRAPGLLKLLLSKVLRGKQQQQQQGRKKKPAALQYNDSFKAASGGGSSNKPAAVAPAPCADHVNAAVMSGQKVGKKKQEAQRYDSYDSDEDEKQRSPVSVLEHPFESSPSPSAKNVHAMDVFRELLDAAYSPALLTQLLDNSDDLATDTTTSSSSSSDEDDDEDCYDGYPASTSSPKKEAAYCDWEAHRAELARVSELVASEVPSARLDHAASALLPEREDVGAAVAAAVLDALLRELVADLATC